MQSYEILHEGVLQNCVPFVCFFEGNSYICQKMKNQSGIAHSAQQFRNIKKRDEFLS